MSRHLKAFTVTETRSADEMRNILFDVFDARAFECFDDEAPFSAEASYFNFGRTSLSYCYYSRASRVEFRDHDYIRFQFCLSGNGSTRSSSGDGDVLPDRVVHSPSDAVLDFGAALDQFVLRLSHDTLTHDLESILGAIPKQSIAFETSASTDNSYTRHLRDLVLQFADQIDTSHHPVPPAILREMDQLLRLSLLYGMPNSLTGLLNQEQKQSAPWQVKRIEEWIDAHWREPITVEKLAEISGASARSIFATFKSARGFSPMHYLKSVRLKAARNMLLNPAPETTVTGVALACNFLNAGHFARDYQAQYGELPSETLRRSKAQSATN